MIYTFKRRRVVQGCFAFFALGIIFYVVVVSWFFIAAEAWPVKALLVALALGFSLTLPGIFADTFSPGPILTISAQGIRYLPFSRDTAPWSAVREVTLTRGYSHARGSKDYYRLKLMDGVSFGVHDPKRFPVPPGGVRADNIAITIMPITVDASPEAITEAIGACWPGGTIREINAAPSDAALH